MKCDDRLMRWVVLVVCIAGIALVSCGQKGDDSFVEPSHYYRVSGEGADQLRGSRFRISFRAEWVPTEEVPKVEECSVFFRREGRGPDVAHRTVRVASDGTHSVTVSADIENSNDYWVECPVPGL